MTRCASPKPACPTALRPVFASMGVYYYYAFDDDRERSRRATPSPAASLWSACTRARKARIEAPESMLPRQPFIRKRCHMTRRDKVLGTVATAIVAVTAGIARGQVHPGNAPEAKRDAARLVVRRNTQPRFDLRSRSAPTWCCAGCMRRDGRSCCSAFWADCDTHRLAGPAGARMGGTRLYCRCAACGLLSCRVFGPLWRSGAGRSAAARVRLLQHGPATVSNSGRRFGPRCAGARDEFRLA
jgi:hypothetical protein